MSDEDLVRWFLAPVVPEWPTEPFRLWPWVEVPDPARWRTVLLFRWESGDAATRGTVVDELRRLREVLG